MRETRGILTVTVALGAALALGACTQVWRDIGTTLHITPASETPTQDIRTADIAAVSELADFQTAAGVANAHPAVQQMQELGAEVLTVLSDQRMSADDRAAILRRILARDLHIPLIARFVLGRHWKTATPEQREAYLTVFADYLGYTYSARLGGVHIDEFRVLEAQTIGEKDILVHSAVAQGSANKIRADWRVREADGRYRIVDLTVEGISMALVLRQEFASVLRNKGGIEGLIAILRQRAA
jgi:phospholipid transport system substrate-binding protein